MKKKEAVGVLFFCVITFLVFPVFAQEEAAQQEAAQQTGIQAMVAPAQDSLAKLGGYLPNLAGVLLILIAGSLIAIGIAALLGWLFKLIQFESGAQKIKIPEVLKKGGIEISLSQLITEIIFFLTIILTLVTALQFSGLDTSVFISKILSYIPHVIGGVFILILGLLLGIFISGIIKLVGGNVRIAHADTLASIAKYAIIIVAALIALNELGLSVILTEKTKDIIFGGVVLAFALAFALGAKERAGQFVNKIFKE